MSEADRPLHHSSFYLTSAAAISQGTQNLLHTQSPTKLAAFCNHSSGTALTLNQFDNIAPTPRCCFEAPFWCFNVPSQKELAVKANKLTPQHRERHCSQKYCRGNRQLKFLREMQVQRDPHHKGGSSDQGIFLIKHMKSFHFTRLCWASLGEEGERKFPSAELRCDLACTAPFGCVALELTC